MDKEFVFKVDLRKIIGTMRKMKKEYSLFDIEDPMNAAKFDITTIIFDNFSGKLLSHLEKEQETEVSYDKITEIIEEMKDEIDKQDVLLASEASALASKMVKEILEAFHIQLLADAGGISESGQLILPNPGSIN